MSRTYKGSKAAGYEYWSKRPYNKYGGTLSPNGGKYHKKRTHKAERRQGRNDLDYQDQD